MTPKTDVLDVYFISSDPEVNAPLLALLKRTIRQNPGSRCRIHVHIPHPGGGLGIEHEHLGRCDLRPGLFVLRPGLFVL